MQISEVWIYAIVGFILGSIFMCVILLKGVILDRDKKRDSLKRDLEIQKRRVEELEGILESKILEFNTLKSSLAQLIKSYKRGSKD